MGFRFQRRIKILPGLSINLSKSGVGFSAGARGFHAGVDSKGRRYVSASLPKTGISWREYQKAKRPNPTLPPLPPQVPALGNRRPESIGASATAPRATRNVALIIVLSLLVVILVAILMHLN